MFEMQKLKELFTYFCWLLCSYDIELRFVVILAAANFLDGTMQSWKYISYIGFFQSVYENLFLMMA